MARAVGEVVARQLLSGEQIAASVSRAEVRSGIASSVESAVHAHVLGHKSFGVLPSSVRSWVAGFTAGIAGEEVAAMLAAQGGELASGMFERLGVAKLVEERLLAMDWDQVEELVFSVSGRELKHIEWMGGILGCLIGFVQAVVVIGLG